MPCRSSRVLPMGPQPGTAGSGVQGSLLGSTAQEARMQEREELGFEAWRGGRQRVPPPGSEWEEKARGAVQVQQVAAAQPWLHWALPTGSEVPEI